MTIQYGLILLLLGSVSSIGLFYLLLKLETNKEEDKNEN